MIVKVYLTEDAKTDLEELHEYIQIHDSAEKADYVINKIADCFDSLTGNPERGRYVKELISLGIKDYREIYFKPYRIIYRQIANRVYVYLIADGRRNLQSFLEKRLFSN